ncbi:MAG: hypothetical protein J5537_03860 [Lachnospiraceae bacterium]|nr:hypothetical protein [Lachnospiraceae bacterium]
MPDFTRFFEGLYTKLQNNTTYSGLKELYILIKEYALSHENLLKALLWILFMAVIHDILTSIYTVEVLGNDGNGEIIPLGRVMLRKGFGGYRIRIPDQILYKTDIPVYRLRFKKVLLPHIRNAELIAVSEGKTGIFTIDESIDLCL